MRILNYVIDDASATTTDNYVLLNQIIHIGSALTTRTRVHRLLDVRPGSVVKKIAAAEVLQAQDITVVGTTNGVVYAFDVNSWDPVSQSFITSHYNITTPTTGTLTATTIAAQLVAQITADTNAKVTAANVAGVITVTAKTGYATFQMKVVNQGDGTGTLTVTNPPSTLGVIAFGFAPYIDLQREGLNSTQYAGSASGYTCYTYVTEILLAENNTHTVHQPAKINIWLNVSDGQTAALITAMDLILNAATYLPQEFDLLP